MCAGLRDVCSAAIDVCAHTQQYAFRSMSLPLKVEQPYVASLNYDPPMLLFWGDLARPKL